MTVLGIGDGYDDDGVLLRLRLADGDEQEVFADQLWAVETPGVNATVLDDYRAFVAEGGLPFDDDKDVVKKPATHFRRRVLAAHGTGRPSPVCSPSATLAPRAVRRRWAPAGDSPPSFVRGSTLLRCMLQ